MAAPHPIFRPIIFLNRQRRLITKARLQTADSSFWKEVEIETWKHESLKLESQNTLPTHVEAFVAF
jgi:hypothetical protein